MVRPIRTVTYRVNIWLDRKPKFPQTPWRGACGCGTTFQCDTFERAVNWPARHFREDHASVIEQYRWDI